MCRTYFKLLHIRQAFASTCGEDDWDDTRNPFLSDKDAKDEALAWVKKYGGDVCDETDEDDDVPPF